jgi:hypothetical protein
MKRIKLALLGLALAATALLSTPSRVESQTACTLLCIQGYHCCVNGTHQSCIPDSKPCP